MEVQQRVYDIDDFWEFVHRPENAHKHLELIDGEIIEMPAPGEEHGFFAGLFFHHFLLFDPERKMGLPTVESGYYTLDDRYTVLAPDAAFRLRERADAPLNKRWVSVMPDIAVEIKSPNDSMAQIRRKAAIYLRHGTKLVWIVLPDKNGVEVCKLNETGKIQTEFIGADGRLSGEHVLPGFELELSKLFS